MVNGPIEDCISLYSSYNFAGSCVTFTHLHLLVLNVPFSFGPNAKTLNIAIIFRIIFPMLHIKILDVN